jgi:AcrR family transcriptional regulator
MPRRASDAPDERAGARRPGRGDLGRTHLLDAAEQVFGRRGFHETTLKEVAERAGCSVGSVYSFFASKEDLFRQIFVRRGDELLGEMEEAVAGDLEPLVQLHRLVDVEVGFFRRHPHFGRLSLRYANVTRIAADTPINARIGGNYDRATRLQAKVFARGQRAGALRAGDPEALSRLFSGLVLSYQALDPALAGDSPRAGVGLPLETLHDLVTSGFRAP